MDNYQDMEDDIVRNKLFINTYSKEQVKKALKEHHNIADFDSKWFLNFHYGANKGTIAIIVFALMRYSLIKQRAKTNFAKRNIIVAGYLP